MTSAPSNNAELVSFANELADSARKVILPFWRQPIDVESKLEHDRPIAESPVTIAAHSCSFDFKSVRFAFIS